MKIGFVTDSTSDVPVDLAKQYGIEVVPAIINIGGKSFKDGVEISREEFYDHLPALNPPPLTSSPSVGTFQECYERLLTKGNDAILSLHPPDKLSGVFNSARLAAQGFGQRVHVLDSGQVSLGLGFQIIMAAEKATRGVNLESVLELVESIRSRVRLMALLNGIEYIRRSGRVSWAIAMIGGLMRLQPLIELRFGIVHRLGQVRTHFQGVERLVETLNSWGPLERLAILHTNAEAAANQLLEKVKAKVSIPPLKVNVTTVIGTHVGPDAVGLVAVPIS